MATRKVLRAVAHNIGHSFTSLGAYIVDDSWAIQHVILALRACASDEVDIDLITGDTTPVEALTPSVAKAVAWLREHFVDMVVRSGSSMDLVTSAKLQLRFRFAETVPDPPPGQWFAPHIIVPEHVPFDCVVTIVDDRGAEHSARVREWWRAAAAAASRRS